MKLLQNIAAASCLIFLSGMNASAQETIKVDDPWKSPAKNGTPPLIPMLHRE